MREQRDARVIGSPGSSVTGEEHHPSRRLSEKDATGAQDWDNTCDLQIRDGLIETRQSLVQQLTRLELFMNEASLE